MKLHELPHGITYDALTMLCGERLGNGMSRVVYTYGPNPTDTVIKIETGSGDFQNVREWSVWHAINEVATLRSWLAPCLRISDYGAWLLQARTTPVTIDELRAKVKKVPAFFTDLKVQNWGRIGKRYVCHDYGAALTTENGINTRLKRADWWQ